MSKKDCHSGNPLVFKTGGTSVYAGGTNRDGGWHRMKPMPQLAMGPIGVIRSAKTRDILPEGWSSSSLAIGGSTPIVIEIDWPDYGIPSNLQGNWWKALVQDIKKKNITSISTQCMGGHGRTGVQLAILAHLLMPKDEHEWKDVNELVTWVRTKFCSHAVESKSQQTYISEVCDIPEGESVISITANPWATTNFDASAIFTEDELKQAEADRQRAERESAAQKNRKSHQGVEWKGHSDESKNRPPKKKYSSPIKKGWSLTWCPDCNNYEWRKTSVADMEWPCRSCGNHRIEQRDVELMNGEGLVFCIDTDTHWHPIEMFSHNRSFKAEATDRRMKIKEHTGGYFEIQVGSSYWPTWFLGEDSAKDIVPVHRIYTKMRKVEKEMLPKPKPNQRKITDNFNDAPPLDITLDPDSQWSPIRDPHKDEPFVNKHRDVLDKYADELVKKRRQSNDEIETED